MAKYTSMWFYLVTSRSATHQKKYNYINKYEYYDVDELSFTLNGQRHDPTWCSDTYIFDSTSKGKYICTVIR